jgi:hypothetical protein
MAAVPSGPSLDSTPHYTQRKSQALTLRRALGSSSISTRTPDNASFNKTFSWKSKKTQRNYISWMSGSHSDRYEELYLLGYYTL